MEKKMVTIGKRPIRLAVGAGHRNTVLNGNPYERGMNGKKVRALLDELDSRQDAVEYWCYTPNRGLGLFPGTYNDAAASIMTHAPWIPDIFLEIHSQGVNSPNVRGAFTIYPDERHISGGNDLDLDVRDFGHVFAEELRQATGIPLYPPLPIDRKPGIMSEQETGVGGDGFRLGVFAVTEQIKSSCSRMLFESGTHSNPTDKQIMDGPGFLPRFAKATANAIEIFALEVMGWIAKDTVYPEPERTLRQELGQKNHIPWEGTRIYRFRDFVSFDEPIVPRRYADVNAEPVGDPKRPVERIRVVGIIAKKNGEKWFLGEDDARYLITGNKVTVR